MKRKTIVILSILLAGLLLGSAALAGVLSERPAKETEIRHKVEEIEVPFAYGPEDLAILEKGRLPAREELKVCLYPEEEILADLRPNIVLRRLLSESYWMMPVILGHYPTDNVRYVENERGGHYYAVWMTDGGARLYVFFDGNTSYPYGYPVYMLKSLSFADFGDLRVGDPADRVGKIDPAYRAYSAGFPSMEEQGKTAKEVYLSEPSYFAWIETGEFTLDTKRQFSLLKQRFEKEKRDAWHARQERLNRPATDDELASLASKFNTGKLF